MPRVDRESIPHGEGQVVSDADGFGRGSAERAVLVVHSGQSSQMVSLERLSSWGSHANVEATYSRLNDFSWRQFAGNAMIRLRDGRLRQAELHWYEGHGKGIREMKRKRYLD